LRILRSRLGRIIRDIRRKIGTHTTKAAWLAHARERSESYDGVW
jgi:hypothetical protein